MEIDKNALQQMIEANDIKTTEDLQALLRDMTKEMIDTIYEGELTAHLGYERHAQGGEKGGNYRNGHGKKSVKSHLGEIELSPPRDRLGAFDPQIVRKRQTDISGLEMKVISMYGKGMTTRDIRDHIYDIYGYELSAESISAITDKVMETAKEWQNRALERLYAIVFMDGIVVKLRQDGIIKNVTVYLVIGMDMNGKKSCLGLYVGESESAKYWLTVMNELKNRGVEDILIFAVDNLTGISDAIETTFPKAEIQKCIVHQIRNSLKFVPWKERKIVAADLKKIYTAPTLAQAESELSSFEEKWDSKYPHIAKSWRKNWAELSTFYKYPQAIRKLIYTTNPIESFNRGIRKVTKTRSAFPTEDALLKLVFLAVRDIEKKWTMAYQDWGVIYSQLSIYFEDILKNYV
jgi:transposase-like protein